MVTIVACILAWRYREALGDLWKYLAAGALGLLAGLPVVLRRNNGDPLGDGLLEAGAKNAKTQAKIIRDRVRKKRAKIDAQQDAHAAEDPGPVDAPNPSTVERFKDF